MSKEQKVDKVHNVQKGENFTTHVNWCYAVGSTSNYTEDRIEDAGFEIPQLGTWSPFVRLGIWLTTALMPTPPKKKVFETLSPLRNSGKSLAFSAQLFSLASHSNQSSLALGGEMLGVGAFFAGVLIPKMQRLEAELKRRIRINELLLARQEQGLQIPDNLKEAKLLAWLEGQKTKADTETKIAPETEPETDTDTEKMRKITMKDFLLYNRQEESLLTSLRLLYEILNTALYTPSIMKTDYSFIQKIPNFFHMAGISSLVGNSNLFSLILNASLGLPLLVGYAKIAKHQVDNTFLSLRLGYLKGELQTRWQEQPSTTAESDAPDSGVESPIQPKKVPILKEDHPLRYIQEEIKDCAMALHNNKSPKTVQNLQILQAVLKGFQEASEAASLVTGVPMATLGILAAAGVIGSAFLGPLSIVVFCGTLGFCLYCAHKRRQEKIKEIADSASKTSESATKALTQFSAAAEPGAQKMISPLIPDISETQIVVRN